METILQKKRPTVLNIMLWVAQLILVIIFLLAGWIKISLPIEKLWFMLPWTMDVPFWLVRFIGICELWGALGLLLPLIFNMKSVLTITASIGLTTIMTMATLFHLLRGDSHVIRLTIAYGLIAVFVIWGRFRKRTMISGK